VKPTPPTLFHTLGGILKCYISPKHIYKYFFIIKKNTHFSTRILAAEVLDRGQEAIEWVTSKGKEKKEKKGTRAGAVGVVPGGTKKKMYPIIFRG
jgi:hypothetical protein